MVIQEKYLTVNKYSRPGTKLSSINGIIVHYVGNPGSSALGNRNYFESLKNGSGTSASAHYIVGLQGEIIQCIPDNEVAWHAGRSYGAAWNEMPKVNNYSMIGIENCHPDTTGKFNDSTYKSLIELIASLCIKYKLGIDKVYRHYDRCGKTCPLYYVNNSGSWSKLKSDVNAKINELTKPLETQTVAKQPEVLSDMKISINDEAVVSIPSILRDGLNYPNLRELMNILGISVGYDAATKVVKLRK